MTMQEYRDDDGQLTKYAWPGGYPIYYLDSQNNILCAECASKDDEYSAPTTCADINWEDSSLCCDDCGTRIESAYAEED